MPTRKNWVRGEGMRSPPRDDANDVQDAYRIAGEPVTDAVGEEFGRLIAERDRLRDQLARPPEGGATPAFTPKLRALIVSCENEITAERLGEPTANPASAWEELWHAIRQRNAPGEIPDPPEAPPHWDNTQASAWGSGWQNGWAAGYAARASVGAAAAQGEPQP